MVRKGAFGMSKKNIKFFYLYRDADNYKQGGHVVFGVPSNAGESIPLEEIEARLRKLFRDGEYFIASDIGVPEVFLWNSSVEYDPDDPNLSPESHKDGYVINDADHCWHEFYGVESTDEEPTDSRSARRFVEEVEWAGKRGWNEFDPSARKVRRKVLCGVCNSLNRSPEKTCTECGSTLLWA